MGYEHNCIQVDEWLDKQECVFKSNMIGGIIKTMPPQKCYQIFFHFEQDTFTIHMDLTLADTLEVIRFEYLE